MGIVDGIVQSYCVMGTLTGAGRQRRGARVLLVDSDTRARSILVRVLREHEQAADAVSDARSALAELAAHAFDVVLVDADDTEPDTLRALAAAVSDDESVRLIAMSEHEIDGYASLIKPFGADDLLRVIDEIPEPDEAPGPRLRLVGRSPEMEALFSLIERVAPTRATVLVLGETGTGKELVARTLHDLSNRASRPFIPVNCSALPETLLESELFGHTRGSFTGAIANRRGFFEEAHGGTLFLDEISTISPAIQAKLLRVVQERVIQRVGSSVRTPVDFRLIAATNVDLAAEVAAGRFREDLFYRLNVMPIVVPPLRNRPGDIPMLVSHFRLKFSRENDLAAPVIEPELLARLSAHSWPGNVRELENFVERVVIMQTVMPPRLSDPALLNLSSTPKALQTAREEGWTLARIEDEYIREVLEQTHGHRAQAARILGIDARTLYRKLRSWS